MYEPPERDIDIQTHTFKYMHNRTYIRTYVKVYKIHNLQEKKKKNKRLSDLHVGKDDTQVWTASSATNYFIFG